MLDWDFEKKLDLFTKGSRRDSLKEGKWGLEKEALRVAKDGSLATTPHPTAYGDKLTNPYITVDFSESQVELITPALDSIEKAHRFLTELHTCAEQCNPSEYFWPLSMPGKLPVSRKIPIAKFGKTKIAKEKEIYRSGLARRYGKKMQLISGIHINFSIGKEPLQILFDNMGTGQDNVLFKNHLYENLARNFMINRWLLIYLFGASPMGSNEFMRKLPKSEGLLLLQESGNRLLENPFEDAVSLRTSQFGYSSRMQNQLKVPFNNLNEYIRNLQLALDTPVDEYRILGIHKNGEQIQLNDNLLQTENEFYSPIRFKQKPEKHQTVLEALNKKGIEYVELRTTDLDPFEPAGISLEQLYFTHLFLIYGILETTEDLSEEQMNQANQNANIVASFGRDTMLKLKTKNGKQTSLATWGKLIFKKLSQIAVVLDQEDPGKPYTNVVEQQMVKLEDVDRLPSSIQNSAIEQCRNNYLLFGLERAKYNKSFFETKNRKVS